MPLVHFFVAAVVMAADTTVIAKAHERLREGQRWMADDEFQKASKAFDEAIALDPLLVMAHYGLGTARMALKEYGGAVTAFEAARAAVHDPAARHASRRAVVDEMRAARIRQLEERMDSTRPQMRVRWRGDGSRDEWRDEIKALERLREEARRPPQIPPGLSFALGSAYFRSGRLADAEREYRAAIEVEPRLGEPRSNLAVVLLITGRAAEAKEQLELAEKSGFKPPAGLKADVDSALAQAPPKTP